MNQLYTIGYEGSDVDTLILTLKAVGVQVLADVRELPLSRKKGLSKKSLSEKLAENGIKYIHFKELGDPKPGREAAKLGKTKVFERIFLEHFAREEAKSQFEQLLLVASADKTCMLCFERCHITCHRSYIADAAVNRGFEVLNLVADRPEAYKNNAAKIPRYYPRQGLAAAE